MDKYKTLNDFLVLNKSLIINMEAQSPEIKTAFDLVLEQIKAKFEIVETINISANKQFKVGDIVKIPLTKSTGSEIENSLAIQNAKNKKQDFMYINDITFFEGQETYVVDYLPSIGSNGDSFLLEDLQPYLSFKVGDKVKIPTTNGFGFDLEQSPPIKLAKDLSQDYLYIKKVNLDDGIENVYYSLTADLNIRGGEAFMQSDLQPYENPIQISTKKEFKVGDKVKIPIKNTLLSNPIEELRTIKEAKKLSQDYLVIKKIPQGYFVLAPSIDSDVTNAFALEDLVPYESPIQLSTNQVKLFTANNKIEIPQEIVDKMLENQLEQSGKKDINIFVGQVNAPKNRGGFNYNETTEGGDFWRAITMDGKFDEFFKKYPKTQTSTPEVKLYTKNGVLIPQEIVDKMLEYQLKDTGLKNISVFEKSIFAIASDGGFSWTNSGDGFDFWKEILEDGNFDKFYKKYPKKVVAKQTSALYSVNGYMIPEEIVDKILEYQLKQTGKQDINVFVKDITAGKDKGGFGWGLTAEDSDFWFDILRSGLFDNFYKKYPKTTQTQSTTAVAKQWKPQELVGKTLYLNGITFLVKKLLRNNIKNKKYELLDIDKNSTVEYNISMSIVEKWLNGIKYRGGEIIEPKTNTKVEGDYATYSQEELKQEKSQLESALLYLDEGDPEINELENKIEIIDVFID